MAYIEKTNWKENETVMPADLNRIEAGVKDAHDGIASINGRLNADIDCGGFVEDTPIATHNREAIAHTTMIVDGNDGTTTTAADLNTHASDPHAHQNLIVNGNAN